MKTVATVYQIENGYLITEYESGRSFYIKEFSINSIVGAVTRDHVAAIRALINKADGKIPAIKAVREYIRTFNVDMSDSLVDVKNYVESIRSDWPLIDIPSLYPQS